LSGVLFEDLRAVEFVVDAGVVLVRVAAVKQVVAVSAPNFHDGLVRQFPRPPAKDAVALDLEFSGHAFIQVVEQFFFSGFPYIEIVLTRRFETVFFHGAPFLIRW
jgi:hypothetical protein